VSTAHDNRISKPNCGIERAQAAFRTPGDVMENTSGSFVGSQHQSERYLSVSTNSATDATSLSVSGDG
jgi:hypothetical protein